jgi:hypothetical protein
VKTLLRLWSIILVDRYCIYLLDYYLPANSLKLILNHGHILLNKNENIKIKYNKFQTHSKIILNIILNNLRHKTYFVILKCLDDKLNGYCATFLDCLCKVNNWSIPGVINLSFGYYYQRNNLIENKLTNLTSKRIFGITSAPLKKNYLAESESIITVTNKDTYLKLKDMPYAKKQIDFYINPEKHGIKNLSGTSYCVPFIVAEAINIFNENKILGIEEMKSRLSKIFNKFS